MTYGAAEGNYTSTATTACKSHILTQSWKERLSVCLGVSLVDKIFKDIPPATAKLLSLCKMILSEQTEKHLNTGEGGRHSVQYSAVS